MADSQGIFITFEGGEGSGKSTQIELLAKNLAKKGKKVVVTREPGGTAEAEKIRELLVQRDGGEWNAIEQVMLFFTARSHLVRTLIRPALERGEIVICDRFTDSTRAYQGYGLGVDLDIIESIDEKSLNSFEPHMTFLLDISANDGLLRSNRRLQGEGSNEDKYERLDIEFHEKLRQGFLTLAEVYSERFCVMDAQQDIQDLASQILHKVEEWI